MTEPLPPLPDSGAAPTAESPGDATRQAAEKREKIEARRAELASRRSRLSAEQRSTLQRFVADRVAATHERAQTIQKRGETGPARLSFSQERLWFLDQLQPGSPAYNIPSVNRFRGPMRLDALRRSLTEIVRRHESLRTTFSADGPFPVQVIAPPCPIDLPVVDLSSLAASAREAEAFRLARRDAVRPFDLTRGPLFRVGLLRLGPEDHVAVTTMHHIVSDGWSMGILVSELGALYEAFATGRPSPLAELPIQYADFAVWQRGWMQGEVLAEHLAFWKKTLEGAPRRLELPTDRPRPKVPSHRGGTIPLGLSTALSDAVRVFCRNLGCTLFMAGTAAFQALLGRYSGQPDICLGTPIAGRRHVETERLIGFFSNTLVLRADLTGGPTVSGLMERVRKAFLEAHSHQDLPFEKLVEELHPERSLGVTPLFQAMFVLQSALRPATEPAADPADQELELDSGMAKFDLTLALSEATRRITGALEYSADLFDGATALRIRQHFTALLEGMVAAPEARLWELPLLGEPEQAQLLTEWNDTARTAAVEGCVHTLFERQAARRPEAVALVFAERALTYADLDRWSSRLARELRALGTGPEVRVAICFERSLEMIVALLAVLKAGGAYVPLDPQFPRERLAFLLEDSGAPVLLTERSLQALFTGARARVLYPEDGGLTPGDEPVQIAASASAEPRNLAYVIYTSGSTGRPKGVEIEHRHLSHYLAAVIERLGLDASSSFATVSTLAADLGNTVVFASLATGGCLHVISSECAADPRAFAGYLRRHAVDCLKIVPSHLAALRATGEPGLLPRQRLILGGEAAAWTMIDSLCAEAPECRIFNHYGPTETTVGVLTYPVGSAGGERRAASLPLGRPLSETQVYVLDPSLQPVPLGVPGELCVGGGGLARGYASRPALTAEKFVPRAWGATPGARLYRTGDRARLLPTGEVEFLGRIDHQVKIRGFRTEPGEIEAALRQHPGVRQAVVLARPDERGETSLVAYVALPDPSPAGELRRFLSERLPSYMIPAAFVALDHLPLTPNGKVDRAALGRLDPARAEERQIPVAPRSPAEQLMAGLWSEVLGIASVGVEDDFFVAGGHSLLATRLVSRVRAAFGVDVPVRSLFEFPTVSGLTLAVESLRSQGRSMPPPLVARPREGSPPLSFAQERLWFLDQMQPGSTAYNVPTAVRLEGELDPAALAWSLTEVTRRHEVLRTRFVATDGVPLQRIDPPAPVPLPMVDLSGLPQERREREAQLLALGEGGRPFDLARGPLLRTGLLRLTARDHVVLASMHHMVSDGWSRGLFISEIGALYDACPDLHRAGLPDLPVQYADYTLWQRAWLRGEALQERVDFWRRQLGGAPPVLDLPVDRPRTTAGAFQGATGPVELSPALSQRLRALGRSEGATSFMILLAVFQAVLARYSGQEDVSVGTPIAGRNVLELEPLIGLFVNTLVLRADLSGGPTFRELLRRVRETALEAHAHQEVPFEKLVEELAPERSLSYSPLFQVMFILQNTPPANLPAAKLRMRPAELPGTAAKFDLTLAFAEDERGFHGSLEHRTDLFDRATIARLTRHLETLFQRIADDPGQRVGELSLLGEEERWQSLAEWNDRAAVRRPRAERLHELVAAQAQRTPEAVALSGRDEAWTYGELMRKAGRLAHGLRRLGVTAEVPVGVCLDRGPSMVAGLLAVLAAGGAYLPLDPEYPPERLRLMVEDAKAPLVLTQAGREGVLAEVPARVLRLDQVEVDGEAAEGPRANGGAGDLAYLIYTSGSTGRPKGVAIEHRSAIELVAWAAETFSPAELSGVLASTSICFDLSVFELFVPLCLGGRVILADHALELPSLSARGEVTLINTVPSAMAELLRQGAVPPSVRTVNLAGEPLPRALADALYALGGIERVYDLYGPSEDTTYSTWARVVPGGRGAPAIGRALPGSRAYVLDRALQPVPAGVPGELYLAGAGLARGYLGRPELTAERFVPDPCAGEPGGRMYRTGDLARHRPDGELDYLGRLDHQVKVRGFRIELGEVEAALAAQPGVDGAAVVARDDLPGGRGLVAYVVACAGADLQGPALRRSLAHLLPDYMLPAAFVFLPELPRTAHGKLDRRALPSPSRDAAPAPAARPLTPVEEMVAAIWSAVLLHDQIGADSNFFELGGHSLLATRVMSRVGGVFKTELPLRDLFEAPTVALLSARVEKALRTGAGPEVPPLVRMPRDAALPLSFAQQRLWFIDRLEPASSLYTLPLALRVQQPLQAGVLARSLSEVVRRHEVLRTTFRVERGEPVQIVAPPAPVDLPVIDLTGLSEPARGEQARGLVEGLGQVRFDLEHGPLFRAGLALLGESDFLVLATMHHILSDAWSLEIFEREVTELYGALAAGRRPVLPELPVQYADFARWQRGWLQGEVLERELAFWRRRLQGAPPALELPTDRPRPALQTFSGARMPFRLPAGAARQLGALSRASGATLFMTVLAAFQLLLSRHTGVDDVCVGTPIAGRTRAEVEPLIGFFVNLLVQRADLAGDPSFRDLLEQVRDTTLESLAHQELPFEKLVVELQQGRDLSRAPLVQVVFQLRHVAYDAAGPEGYGADRGGQIAKFDLVLNADAGPAGLTGTWKYNTDLFDRTTMARISSRLEVLLAAVALDADRRLSALPVLSAAEHHQVTTEWAPPAEHAGSFLLHERFAAQARETPAATAVVCGEERLSYRELELRADRLARFLIAAGVRPGERVALCLERSSAMIVAILGVLQSGTAYVPLDPDYPRERLAFMLADSGARLLLTQSWLAEALPELTPGTQLVCLDQERESIDHATGGAPPRIAGAGSLAYVIYTSGSTGQPKGVGVAHSHVARLFTATEEWFDFVPTDVWTLFHSYAFDFSVWEIWGALLHGGRLVVVPHWVSRTPDAFRELLVREGVTVLSQTPSAFRQLLRAEEAREDPGLAGLRLIVFGGEALDCSLLGPWIARYGDDRPRLVNMYGITETTVHVTYRRISQRDLSTTSVIGRPIPDLGLRLLDREMNPVPVGVPGEIYVSGAGVSWGYLGRPELTAARFVPDASGDRPGERSYRTGDSARHLPDGDLEYLGRIDQQVKIRGFRIELGEIEAALRSHPEVREAIVTVDKEPEPRLVAYLVLAGGAEEGPGPAALRSFLAGLLPDYMLPAAWVVLPALPLTAHGKIDRRALPPPDAGRQPLETEVVAPGTELESFLAGLWRDALKIERVGIHDDFFALGGNSISGAILINRLQEELREIVHVVAIFDAPTVAGLAKYLIAQSPEAVSRTFGPLDPGAAASGLTLRSSRVDATRAGELRRLVRPLAPAPGTLPGTAKNPPAVFVLSPPRSGSTLLRVMLAGHPGLFAPPELELLSFGTLGARREAFSGRDRFWLEGLLRAVMEIRGCDAATAEALVEDWERQDRSTQEVYRHLQGWLGHRILVDKTPSYALDRAVLDRAEEVFEGACYIHLIRHPCGMIRSFEEAKLDQVFFNREHPFSRRELAELIWLVSHQNIAAFLARVPRERQLSVRFEELLSDPAAVLGTVCAFLGIDFHPDMAQPYEAGSRRMTDGVHAVSRMLGDVKFHQHAGIDRATADRWREVCSEEELGDPTLEMAALLGYQVRRPTWQPIERRPVPPGEPLPLSYAQERLWFLEQMAPGSSVYNIPTAVRFTGRLDTAALARALGEVVHRHEALRTIFRTVDGAPVQIVSPASSLALPMVDLSALPARVRQEEARQLAGAASWSPFDLARGPLFRAGLLRLTAGDHLVLATLHHIVGDGWSMRILNREVAALYKAFAEGEPSPLQPLPVQYADFARWQREWLQGEALERELAHWQEQLRGLPPLLELPTDRPRPAVQTFRGAACALELDSPRLWSGLQALGRETGTTPFMVLVAGFHALLSRYSGQDDVAVGIPVAGRTRRELQELIGFFVNTLVLRGDLANGPGFRELLARTRVRSLAAFAHQELPFEKLVEALEPARSLGHSPLFQAMFTLQILGEDEAPAVEGLNAAAVGLESHTAKFDLTLALSEAPQRFSGALVYNTDLFDAATARRMLDHFAALLSAAVSSPEVPLADLPLMNDSERHQVATEWGAGTTPDRALRNALERAHEWAVRSPEALAVGAGDEWVTYGELARRARTLARRLRRERVRGETVVGIFLERSVELIVGIWATLLAEGAWLPFDPESPPERVGTIFADAGARVMLTSSSLRERLPALEATVLELDRMGWTAEATGAELVPDIEPDGLAYVIYTSGSTGRPKGVEVTHRGLANLIRWYERSFDLGPGCRVTQLASPSFDASVLEIWPCLASGASLHVAPAPVRSSPSALLDWLRREGITHCFLPTPLAEAVFQEEWPGEMALRFLLTGGDRLRRAPDREPGFRLVNLYGPTEGSVVSTSSRVEAGRAGAPPIGRPISGTWVCVQDAGGRLQPPGVAGELCIGGPGVARGYLRRPDLTAERFVPGEGGQAGERLYRTGDRARWLADGQLEFLDRLDQQVKVRGFRIEPGEIEAALAAHPAVREAVVSVREDSRSERSLVAYLATGEEPLPAASELRRFLGRTLPEHMIPAAFVGLPELPLTPQGKVDRRALHSSFPAAAAASSLAQPRTPIEEIVAALWSEVLHVEQVGPQDDFFQLGGHSLLATRVISRLRSVFRIELPLRDLFASPSLAELSRTIENLLAGGSDEMQALRPRPRDTALPLSFAQQRLWFIDRLQPGSPVYNLCSAVRFTGALDAPALAATFSEITRRHEVLRTTFEEHGGEPVQVIHPWAPRPLPVIDLSALPEEVRNREGRSLAAAESLRSFDLASGPLFRAGLLRFAAAEHVVVATMHHIVGDGWSVGVLHQEVSALYNSFTRGLDSPLPELAVQYADYALWQRDWMSGELLERELAYWRERLRGIPPVLPLPADHPRPARPTYRGGRRGLRWPADLAGALQTLGRRNGATLFMVLLAGFQSLLSRLTGERNICVGTPIAGRNRVEIENLIGFFVNTLVLRADLGGEPSFLTLLERVREASLEAYAHPNLPFERLVQDLAPERTMSYSPLFQVLLVLQNAPEGGGSIAGLAVESLGSVERPTARYDLALSVREAGGSLLGLMEYATDLFEGVTVERMLRQLEGLLGAAAASPRSVLGELPLLTSGELHQVLLEWNDVPGGEEPGRCLHELFESWADAQPAAPAVVWETGSMSYGALERHANRLAWHLRGLGVGPEARVGLCVDRTGALPVGVLGILKAGGAFVPLDPSYPRERLGWIVADAGLDLLVSDQESLGLLPAEGLRTVLLDRDSGEIELASAARPASGVGAGHLAYVIYTSGSTGRPKGVLVEHRGLANVAAEQAEVFRAGVGDSVLQMASPGFDAAVAEIVTSLCLGGRLCLARRESLLPGPGLLELLRSRSVTHVTMTPAVLAELPWEALAELRTLVVAGEACPAELVGRWGDGRRLVNAYGPTEATIWSTAEVCAPEGGAPAIGRPIANVRVHVLDAALRPVPVYVAGELCVAGVGVARGYLGLPDLTAERFVPDPYGKEPGSRLYRTGDLARYRADGRIDFLGRLDEQVKIRGVRIELGEIEAALRRHPAVRDAAVAAREEGPAGRRLLAWVVAADAGQPPAAAELRRFLAASLPAPMIPAAVESITALPVTPHGKIDRLAIARLTSGGPGLRSRVAPRNESELRLLEIWEEVLGTGPLGVTEDFFQAGGHSLLAVRLLARIREKTGKELPLATLFTGSSVERMAALLERDLPRHREPLVALRTVEASRAPLFLVHPVGGNVLCYAELVRAMEPDRSIYGLQAPDPGAAFPASLEAMAAGYLEAIRQVQPEPPYHLAGWSMGGVLAFEMARQLHRRGRQQVGLLALLDAEPPLAAREPTGEMDLLRMFARDLAGLSLGESPRRLPELAPGEPALEELFGFAHRSGLIPPGLDLATTRRLFDVFRADVELLRAYAGKPCPGPALLLLGAETVHSRRDVAPAWGTLIENGLAVEITPGQHYSLLRRPQVESVAERLHAALLRSEC